MRILMSMFLVMTLGLVGCATKVTRTDVDKVMDFSGQWNDTDSSLVAAEMISSCLNGRWLTDFMQSGGRTPVVIIGTIKNRTFEHIDSLVFTKDLERELLNSGKVQFVASKDERLEIREEREDQQAGNTDPATISARGSETGADYMLQGTVNSVKDAVKGKYAVFYQVNLELIDLKTNRKVWISQKEIKKLVERPRASL